MGLSTKTAVGSQRVLPMPIVPTIWEPTTVNVRTVIMEMLSY